MLVTKEIGIDYGHTLPNHMGFCNQLHGHRARIIVAVEGSVIKEVGSSQGMVMDFKFIKQLMMEKIHDVLDHGFAVWKDDTKEIIVFEDAYAVTTLDFVKARNKKVLVTDEPPTAEYLAKWAFNQIGGDIAVKGCQLMYVDWYETPNCFARYTLADSLS